MATRRRLVSVGNRGGGRLSWPTANAAKIARDHQQQYANDREGLKQPVVDFNPAKQRRDAEQAGGEQKDAGGGKQPGGKGVGCERCLSPGGSGRASRTASPA